MSKTTNQKEKEVFSISKVIHDFLIPPGASLHDLKTWTLRWPKHLSLATIPQKFPETDFAIVPSCTERTPASWSFLIAITSATHGRTAKEKVSTTAVAFTYGIRR